jgi:hypothetical protein
MPGTAVAVTTSVLLVAGALALADRTQAPASAGEQGRPFAGTWSATGQRRALPTEHEGEAAIVQLSGSVVIDVGQGLGRGFRGELIGFDDGRALTVGRWVWTDEHGDRVFGEVKGEPMQAGRRFEATITGGTGRHAGVTGRYAFRYPWS